jgi:hypothetical protein
MLQLSECSMPPDTKPHKKPILFNHKKIPFARQFLKIGKANILQIEKVLKNRYKWIAHFPVGKV